jgi:hypothetical protein
MLIHISICDIISRQIPAVNALTVFSVKLPIEKEILGNSQARRGDYQSPAVRGGNSENLSRGKDCRYPHPSASRPPSPREGLWPVRFRIGFPNIATFYRRAIDNRPYEFSLLIEGAILIFAAKRPSLGGRWRGEAVTDEGYAPIPNVGSVYFQRHCEPSEGWCGNPRLHGRTSQRRTDCHVAALLAMTGKFENP